MAGSSSAAAPAAVASEFAELYARVADCPNCPLARTRTQTVPGSGPSSAEVLFIGEAPGQREDEQGLPFVGPAGRFLDELLGVAGWSRADVYITNVVKCRPPNNRDPELDEIAACRPYLEEQPEDIDPRVIVTLGRFSMQRWFPGASISRLHGQPRRVDDGRLVVPMYHPAAALHNGSLRAVIMEDFARLPSLVEEARGGPRSPALQAPAAAPSPVTAEAASADEPAPSIFDQGPLPGQERLI